MRRTFVLFSLFIPLVLANSGCVVGVGDWEDWGSSNRYKEDFSYDFKLAPGGRLELEGFNGSVEVIGWDSDAVQIRGTKHASRETTLSDIRIDAHGDSGLVSVRATRPSMNCSCGTSFIVKVPRKTRLDRVESSNGSLRVENIEGDSRVKTTNGTLKLWNLTGNVEASTSNASVEADRLHGEAILKTSNGRVKASDIRGRLEATTSNGSIEADIAEPEPSRAVVLSTSNSSITLQMDKLDRNDIRASTSNSSINLQLPDTLDATVNATTSNGSISTDYEVTTSTISKNVLKGRIGNGGPLLDLHTSNGSIRLKKR